MENDFLHSVEKYLTKSGFQKKMLENRHLAFALGKHYILPFTLEDLGKITDSAYFYELKLQFRKNNINLIFLWEDRWVQQSESIKLRLKTITGDFISIHARQTEVKKVSRTDQITFIEDNHFHVFTKANFSYGLYYKDELMVLGTFDRPRKWKRENGTYISVELVRFANKQGYIVSGGVSKLMKAVAQVYSANDIMTFIDTDWSDGSGFMKAGFKEISHTGGIAFYVHPKTFDRIHGSQYDETLHPDWIKVWNTGSFKMVKEMSDTINF